MDIMCIIVPLFFLQSTINGNMLEWMNAEIRPCSFSGAYKLEKQRKFMNCVTECQLTSSCQSVMYLHRNGICGFFNESPGHVTTAGAVNCVFVNVTSIDRSNLGQCGNVSCPAGQKCEESGTSTTCTPVLCQDPPSVTNSYTSSAFRIIGSKLTYFCNHGYSAQGRGSITCRNNGTWSDPSVLCVGACKAPLALDNSILVGDAPHRYNIGTKIYLECSSGYHSNGFSRLESVCSNQGGWDPEFVPCCAVGFTFDTFGNRCFQLEGDTTLTTYKAMRGECKPLDSHIFYWTDSPWNLELLQHIIVNASNDMYVLLGLKKENIIDNLLDCFNNSEATASKHEDHRYNDVIDRLENVVPGFNSTTGAAYGTLRETLFNANVTEFSEHLKDIKSDVENRLSLIPNITTMDITNKNYTELVDLLHIEEITRARYESSNYDELFSLLNSTSALVAPPCEELPKWYPGNPDGGNRETCILMGPGLVSKFHDVDCNHVTAPDGGKLAFICRDNNGWSLVDSG